MTATAKRRFLLASSSARCMARRGGYLPFLRVRCTKEECE
jgi:hypothetical protein